MNVQGKQLSKLIFLPSEKVSTLKGKNWLPLGAISFLLEYIPFQEGPSVQKSKKLSLISKMAGSIDHVCPVP